MRPCPACQTQNPVRSSFCRRCGQALSLTGGSRSCPVCGTPFAASDAYVAHLREAHPLPAESEIGHQSSGTSRSTETVLVAAGAGQRAEATNAFMETPEPNASSVATATTPCPAPSVQNPPSDNVAPATVVPCPDCGTENPATAVSCEQCWEDLQPAPSGANMHRSASSHHHLVQQPANVAANLALGGPHDHQTAEADAEWSQVFYTVPGRKQKSRMFKTAAQRDAFVNTMQSRGADINVVQAAPGSAAEKSMKTAYFGGLAIGGLILLVVLLGMVFGDNSSSTGYLACGHGRNIATDAGAGTLTPYEFRDKLKEIYRDAITDPELDAAATGMLAANTQGDNALFASSAKAFFDRCTELGR